MPEIIHKAFPCMDLRFFCKESGSHDNSLFTDILVDNNDFSLHFTA